jgi:signal transduction histidine kinase/HPt (histidine-containing phosphotransfer) domain-containing protein/ActR/RegA family two-component response regulator
MNLKRIQKRVIAFLINIATSGKYSGGSAERKGFGMSDYLIRYVLLNVNNVLAFFFLLQFTIKNYMLAAYVDAVLCFGTAVICPVIIVLARTRISQTVPATLSVFGHSLFCVLLVWNGDYQGFNFVFVYSVPMYAITLLGIRYGVILAAALLAALGAELLIPGLSRFNYPPEIAVRILTAYSVLFYVPIVVEISRKIKDRFIEDQNRRLEELRVEADAANRAKSSFLASMSHEIRTPMNAIIGLSKLALREDLPPKARSYCADVNSAANNLLTIINDILDFSRIESGKMEILNAEYQFASLVNDVITIIRMRLRESAVRFTADIAENIPGRLIGDEARIRQVLLNLLSNAVKYTREGQIVFSVRADTGKDGEVILQAAVADTGIGIKPEDRGKLFGNFNRLDMEKNKNVEGTGLGLAITLNLCRAMGGDITVESEYGKGSVFTAIIPQRAEDLTPFTAVIDADIGGRQEEAAVKFTAPTARVLIVDDISMNLKVAEGLMSPYEIRVDTAQSGQEAVNLARRHEYDIIFMDHMMPGMDGIEATALIRGMEGERFKTVPVIALTANAMTGMREMFLEKGFSDYLSKPMELPKLDELLARWIPGDKKRRGRSGELGGRDRDMGGAHPSPSSTPHSPLPTPLTIPGVDVQRGIAMTGGTVEGYRKVLALFRQDALERLPLLQTPPEPEALPLFVTQVHALKSALASIGAAETSAQAEALEAAGKAGDLAAITKTLPPFAEHLAALVQEIRAALMDGIENGEWKMESAKEPLAILNSQHSILNSLAAALEAQNAGDTDTLLEELGKQTLDAKTRETIEQVSDQVLMADYGAALGIVNKLVETNIREA